MKRGELAAWLGFAAFCGMIVGVVLQDYNSKVHIEDSTVLYDRVNNKCWKIQIEGSALKGQPVTCPERTPMTARRR